MFYLCFNLRMFLQVCLGTSSSNVPCESFYSCPNAGWLCHEWMELISWIDRCTYACSASSRASVTDCTADHVSQLALHISFFGHWGFRNNVDFLAIPSLFSFVLVLTRWVGMPLCLDWLLILVFVSVCTLCTYRWNCESGNSWPPCRLTI